MKWHAMASPAHPDDHYFAHARREIAPLLPERASRVLEIGCSSGATLGWLRQRWPKAEMLGVDGHAPLEPLIRARAGAALIHDLDQPLPEMGSFDLILALDILEHLRHPDSLLADLATRLRPGGVCIVSVPNMANYQIIGPLLFQRRFRYTDAGPMDRTHLRWFTEESLVQLLQDAGLSCTTGVVTGFTSRRRRLVDALSLGRLRHYLAVQYIVRGARGLNGPMHWHKDWPRL